MNKFAELGGYVGMCLVQGALLPSAIAILWYEKNVSMPWDYVLMLWIGLSLYLIRSIARKDTLYIISNSIGVLTHTIFMILMIGTVNV